MEEYLLESSVRNQLYQKRKPFGYITDTDTISGARNKRREMDCCGNSNTIIKEATMYSWNQIQIYLLYDMWSS